MSKLNKEFDKALERFHTGNTTSTSMKRKKQYMAIVNLIWLRYYGEQEKDK